MSGRVLVTGGAGFIGSHLVEALLSSGHRVTILDDLSTGTEDNIAAALATDRARLVTGSILDPSAVAAAMSGCSTVFHLAVECMRRSLGHPRQSHDVNATGTLDVLEAARARGVSRFVYCSSSEVYGSVSSDPLDEETTPCRPVTVYGAAKLAGELYADAYRQTYGLPTVIVRPFNAYGPRAPHRGESAEVIPRFAIRVLNGLPPVVFGDGSNGRDFTYVSDVSRGLLLAGFSDGVVGKRLNIARGRMLTVREVATAVMSVCNRNDLSILFARPRPGDVHVLRASTERARELVGYSAAIAFEEGVRRYLNWLRARHPDVSTLLEEDVENWRMPASGRGGGI